MVRTSLVQNMSLMPSGRPSSLPALAVGDALVALRGHGQRLFGGLQHIGVQAAGLGHGVHIDWVSSTEVKLALGEALARLGEGQDD